MFVELPWSTWAEISTRKIFVHIPVLVVSSFSSHISVVWFTLEYGSLQLLWLLFQFVVEVGNPVRQKLKKNLKRHCFVDNIFVFSPYSVTIHSKDRQRMTKDKRTCNDLQSTMQKTRDWGIGIPKQPRCSGIFSLI